MKKKGLPAGRQGWGFDKRDIDASVRAQDDFFHHANGSWFKRSEIPADEARWGTFLILRKRTELQLKSIVEKSKNQQIRDLYRSGMNMTLRNKLDDKPLKPLLEKIAGLKNSKELVALIPELHRIGVGILWGAGVDIDEKDTKVNIMHIAQGGLGLPERDYYLLKKPEQLRVRAAYQIHVAKMLGLIGKSAEKAGRGAEMVMKIETELAKASMRKEDMRDPHKTYHKLPISTLQSLSKGISWRAYFIEIGVRPPTSVNVMQPGFIKAVEKMLHTIPIGAWQAYLTWHLLSEVAPYLSDRFIETSFEFYGKTLTGAKDIKPLWRRSLNVVNGSLGEALGKLYIEKYFPPEAKQKMDELISNLFIVYEERLKNLEWMSTATKKRALRKLHAMVRKIGYPKKWKSYKGLKIRPHDYFGNVLRSALYEHRRNMRKLRKKVDRSEWHMTPQTVNAYYNPCTNEIAFPAAILQPPYFGPDQDDAVNYGAIGAVIGHEITHGFDDEGSKFDEKGNLKSWWTKEDRKRFEKRAQVLKKQFDEYHLYGVHVNGKLTLGENIADLGGYAIALDAYHRHLSKTGHTVIESFTPIQRFFFGMAQDWRQISRPEVEKTMLLVDPHAPSIFRTNGPVSNLPEFYEAFGVKKGDKLYRDPKQRAKIW